MPLMKGFQIVLVTGEQGGYLLRVIGVVSTEVSKFVGQDGPRFIFGHGSQKRQADEQRTSLVAGVSESLPGARSQRTDRLFRAIT